MYSGDEFYGDDITSPLYRPLYLPCGLVNPLARFPVEQDTECLTCDGRGGTLEYDSDGDGAWAMTFTRLDPCPDCLGQNKCPGCGKQSEGIDLNTFICEACGWAYDESRFDPSEDFYTEGY